MRAIDTNILVRAIMQEDDPEQSRISLDVLAHPTLVPITVLMECEWVLRSRFRASRAMIAAALRRVLDLPTIHVEDEAAIRWALDRFEAGADLADMLHLVAARGAETFATFDRGLVRSTDGEAPVPVVLLAGS